VNAREAVMNSDKSSEVAVAEMRCCNYTEIVDDAQNCLEVAAVEVEAAVVADSALFLACSRTVPDKSRTTNTLVVETCLWYYPSVSDFRSSIVETRMSNVEICWLSSVVGF
jgi:hypothetical protein